VQSKSVLDPADVSAFVDEWAHPVRGRLYCTLGDLGEASARELAQVHGISLSKVRHHLRALMRAGLIAVGREERRRGVVERYYSSLRSLTITAEEDRRLPERERQRIALAITRVLFAEVTRGIAAQTLTSRPDRCLARVWGEVDLRGWRELSEIHHAALGDAERIIQESGERLRAGGEEPIGATSTFLLFESPLRGGAQPAS
jgi:DNA-binding transcriptional ArsR family regulator